MALAQYQKWYHTNFGRETVGGNFVTSRHYKVTHSDNKRSLFAQITIKSSSNTDSSDVISCLFRTTLGGLTTVMWRSYCSQKRHLFQTQRGPNWNLKPIFGLMLVQLPLENEKLTAVVNLKKLVLITFDISMMKNGHLNCHRCSRMVASSQKWERGPSNEFPICEISTRRFSIGLDLCQKTMIS